MKTGERIAAELLGVAALDPGGFAPCPGQSKHTKKSGSRDFRVTFDRVPTGFCFHGSCSAEVEEFNLELRRRLWRARHGDRQAMPKEWGKVAPEPRREPERKRPEFDDGKLREVAGNVAELITPDWLVERSPVPLMRGMKGVGAQFLEMLYEEGEKVLVFTEFASQGQFGYHVGRGGWRLGRSRGVKAVSSDLPTGGPDGVWFLCNPVCGEWKINHAAIRRNGEPSWGRRHGDCVTAWRYLILESDVANPLLWLKVLVQLALPIVAIYSSGGKSLHAMVRLDAKTKAHFDRERDLLVAVLAPLGADAAAMTGVRLSRLPGCLRGDRLQELLYLDPAADGEAIYAKRRVAR